MKTLKLTLISATIFVLLGSVAPGYQVQKSPIQFWVDAINKNKEKTDNHILSFNEDRREFHKLNMILPIREDARKEKSDKIKKLKDHMLEEIQIIEQLLSTKMELLGNLKKAVAQEK